MIPQRHKLDWNSNRIPNLIDNATSSSYNNLVGSANTSTIVTTKVGTFSSTWKGSGTLYFDPGDGGAVEPLVLTAGGVTWNHEYLLAGNKTINITGDLDGATTITLSGNSIINSLNDVVTKFTSVSLLYLSNNYITGDFFSLSGLNSLYYLSIVNNSLTCDLSSLATLTVINYLYVYGNSLTFTYTQFPPWSGNIYDLHSTVSTSQEVGDLIRAAANGGMNNCIYKLDGTNPAPPSTQEVLDGIDTLAGNGVTLYVST
jgi:Leucine-rich repeat (LRR) protein